MTSMPMTPVAGEPTPLYLSVEPPATRVRLTAAFRLILAIPQFFVLFFVIIAAFVVLVIGWFGALFTGRLPTFAADFLTGVVRWTTRVSAYVYFLTDEYPPFSMDDDPSYPVRFAFPARERLNPLAVFFRLVLVIPAAIVSSVLGSGNGCLSIASWACIVFTGRMPVPLYEATRVIIRYHMRLNGYFWMLTAEYPWGVMGDQAASPTVSSTEPQGMWELFLSKGGRTAVIVAIVLGVLAEIANNTRRR